MSKNIKNIVFNVTPIVLVRTINFNDPKEVKKNKTKCPFELKNDVIVTIYSDFTQKFSFRIAKGYIWNGADIPRILWRIIGSKTDNAFLIASMVHDYLLENKKVILNDIIKNDIIFEEYRKLTSLAFREIVKKSGTNTIKANIMSFTVDVYQKFFNRKEWKICN